MPTSSEPWLEHRIVLILCGLVGSGKSTFAEQLQHHFPQFRRCNQDELGDRRQVEQLARDCLAAGTSVCIDRTNFNSAQRSHWIQIAREFPGTSVWVIVFDTPYETCAARLRMRTSHPTIKSAEQGLYVLSRFAAEFELPDPHEGYDRIISLKSADHSSAVYARSEIATILQRLHKPSRSFVDNPYWSYTIHSYYGAGHLAGGGGDGFTYMDMAREQLSPR